MGVTPATTAEAFVSSPSTRTRYVRRSTVICDSSHCSTSHSTSVSFTAPLGRSAVWRWSRIVCPLLQCGVSWATLWVTVTPALCLHSSSFHIKIDVATCTVMQVRLRHDYYYYYRGEKSIWLAGIWGWIIEEQWLVNCMWEQVLKTEKRILNTSTTAIMPVRSGLVLMLVTSQE